MDVIRNAWELEEGDDGFLKLSGRTTREEFERDRQQHAAEIVQFCSITRERRGFEIGSGDGTVARLVAPQCQSLDCNDLSASFLEIARAKCADLPNVSFHKIGDNYLDHLSADTYDFGFSLHVFIHLNAYDIYNYLIAVKRILRPGGVFYFDACTLGPQTMTVFREHAEMYRKSPEIIRGLLNFNHPVTLQRVIAEAGMEFSDQSRLSEEGWMKVLTQKPAGTERKGFRLFRR
jgi:SAM-dependent methyltransferase